MIIHVVKPKETIYSIADKYQITVARLVQDNGLTTHQNLATGQTLVIAYPKQIYTVQEGDSLNSIAETNHVSAIQLLRNNPFLSNREYIYPGETLVISYGNNKNKISTNGYAYTFIDRAVLKKTLPYLTYLSIFNYRTVEGGEIVGVDDTELIKMAKDYGVAPLMFLTVLSTQGESNYETVSRILNNPVLVEQHIDRILEILKASGYYGLNITFTYLDPSTKHIYENYAKKFSIRFQREGYPVFITINPNINFLESKISYDKIDYSDIAQTVNGITFLTFSWGYTVSPPVPNSVYMAKDFYDYAVTVIPPEKISIGIPVIGYNWPLPYEAGISKATSLTFNSAIALAYEVGAVILYDETYQAAYFKYIDNSSGVPIQHIVWFKDARSIDALVKLVPTYGFKGIGIWNIMQYFDQMWLVINTQYEIETVL